MATYHQPPRLYGQLSDIGNHIRDLRAMACFLQDVLNRDPLDESKIHITAKDMVDMFDMTPAQRESIFIRHGINLHHRVWLGKQVSTTVQDSIDSL